MGGKAASLFAACTGRPSADPVWHPGGPCLPAGNGGQVFCSQAWQGSAGFLPPVRPWCMAGGAFDVRLRAPGRTRPEAKSAIVQAGTDCAVEAKRQPSPGLGPGRRTHPRRPGSRISMRRREGSGSLNAAGPATCRSSAIRLRFPLCLSAERSCRPCGRASGSIPFPRHRA